MGRLSATHTFAELEVSPAAYDEIAGKLREADYGHAFMDGGAIDMHGIGLVRAGADVEGPSEAEVARLLAALSVSTSAPKAEHVCRYVNFECVVCGDRDCTPSAPKETSEPRCTCFETTGDDPKCRVCWKGLVAIPEPAEPREETKP